MLSPFNEVARQNGEDVILWPGKGLICQDCTHRFWTLWRSEDIVVMESEEHHVHFDANTDETAGHFIKIQETGSGRIVVHVGLLQVLVCLGEQVCNDCCQDNNSTSFYRSTTSIG